jgi:hypothetical protein
MIIDRNKKTQGGSKHITVARLMRYWRILNEDPNRVCLLKDFGYGNGRVYVNVLMRLGLIEAVPIYFSGTGRNKKGRKLGLGYKLIKRDDTFKDMKGGKKYGRRRI